MSPAQPHQPETLGELPCGMSAPTARHGMQERMSTTANREESSPAGRKRMKSTAPGMKLRRCVRSRGVK